MTPAYSRVIAEVVISRIPGKFVAHAHTHAHITAIMPMIKKNYQCMSHAAHVHVHTYIYTRDNYNIVSHLQQEQHPLVFSET